MGNIQDAAGWDPAVERVYTAIIEAADENIRIEGGDWDSWRNGKHLAHWAYPEDSELALSSVQRKELIESLDEFLSMERDRIRARRNAERDDF
ncbi:hypothetical protein ILT44_04380 [Microvirga sp. BT689]|uniref:hypothetical protein n=1 Tax=Microvirga arvi TaxID=2778731 RepID=UPI0019515B73|nr:hypothetical protein [Microvirga arvi]MBM6579411.1 hypothetical protein [Microvirga arvi]